MQKMNVYSPANIEHVVKTIGSLLIPEGEPRQRFEESNDYQRLWMIERQVKLRLEETRQLRRGDLGSDENVQALLTAAASDNPGEAADAANALTGRNYNQAQVRGLITQVKAIRRRAGAAAAGMADLRDKGLIETTNNAAAHDFDLVIDKLVEVAGQHSLTDLRRYLLEHENPQEIVDALKDDQGDG